MRDVHLQEVRRVRHALLRAMSHESVLRFLRDHGVATGRQLKSVGETQTYGTALPCGLRKRTKYESAVGAVAPIRSALPTATTGLTRFTVSIKS